MPEKPSEMPLRRYPVSQLPKNMPKRFADGEKFTGLGLDIPKYCVYLRTEIYV